MRLLAAILFSGFTQLVFAADEKPIQTLSSEPVGVAGFLQMFFGLALIVLLILGLAWFMRRMGGFQGVSHAHLKVISGISVGQRERIVLVQAGETQLVVGIAPGHISTLHVMEKPIQTDEKGQAVAPSSFAEKLQSLMKQKGQS